MQLYVYHDLLYQDLMIPQMWMKMEKHADAGATQTHTNTLAWYINLLAYVTMSSLIQNKARHSNCYNGFGFFLHYILNLYEIAVVESQTGLIWIEKPRLVAHLLTDIWSN